jgi:transcriptional regulator with XRE-family HTH domain
MNRHIGQALRFVRQSLNMEMRDVANLAGVTPQFVSAIETGSRVPSWNSMCSICEAMGIEVSLVTMLHEQDSPAIKPMMPIVYSKLWERSQTE